MGLDDKKIGLALSGGGIRAAIFHLGVMKYLAEEGLYNQINHISSVSGASLCIGVIFAVNNNKWPTSDIFLKKTLPDIEKLMLKYNIQLRAILRLLITPWHLFNRVMIIAKVIEKRWGIRGHLQELPEFKDEKCNSDCPSNCPYWEINCTTFETGGNFRIRKDYMGDKDVGYVMKPELEISHMIAASAGFPGLIGPYRLKTKKMIWHKENNENSDETDVKSKYSLWDGGIYDNLGLEALHKIGGGSDKNKTSNENKNTLDETINFLIVSDAGASFGFQKRIWNREISVSNAKRLLGIVLNQINNLRKDEFCNTVVEDKNGLYLQISGKAQKHKTTLWKPNDDEFKLILDNGYRAAKKALSEYYTVPYQKS